MQWRIQDPGVQRRIQPDDLGGLRADFKTDVHITLLHRIWATYVDITNGLLMVEES